MKDTVELTRTKNKLDNSKNKLNLIIQTNQEFIDDNLELSQAIERWKTSNKDISLNEYNKFITQKEYDIDEQLLIYNIFTNINEIKSYTRLQKWVSEHQNVITDLSNLDDIPDAKSLVVSEETGRTVVDIAKVVDYLDKSK